MKELIIICEGKSELMFCDEVLKSHFYALGIAIEYPLIAHSGGGIVRWEFLKKEIELHYNTKNDRFITTFIDYYGLYDRHLFPEWNTAHLEMDKNKRMAILEKGMIDDVSVAVKPKFIPNILLHEFETLIFSDYTVFNRFYAPNEFKISGLANLAALCAIDPETINNGLTSAPSKRLIANIQSYDKVNDGIELAKLIGLPAIRLKCPRFNAWITKLEKI